ncbi:MAG: hypothetical protein HY360_09280 [Verrucomicrobia bacterium]|nr:hypothetical protein [Verrucomicrobiota bacterium]
MMTSQYADSVSDIVSRLGVKARAAGIALVFAAQRPDAYLLHLARKRGLALASLESRMANLDDAVKPVLFVVA